jgi:uncharacterized membrane protein YhaH (DUF805 family)
MTHRMTRSEMISIGTHLFLDSHGRIGRRDFWLAAGVLLVVSNLLHLIWGIGSLISFALFYCWVCLFAKRLHDMGKSGWLQIAPHVINAVCIFIGVTLGAFGLIMTFFSGRAAAATGVLFGGVMAWAGALLVVFGISAVNTLVFLLWVGLTRGQEELNAYGPTPGSIIPVGPTHRLP